MRLYNDGQASAPAIESLTYELRFRRTLCVMSSGRARFDKSGRLTSEYRRTTHKVDRLNLAAEARSSELLCHSDFSPIRYVAHDGDGTRTEIEFGRQSFSVTLPGGGRRRRACGKVDLVLDTNMIPQLAFKLAIQPPHRAFQLNVFSPDVLDVFKYAFEPATGGWITNLGERIWIGPDGYVSRIRFEPTELEARRASFRGRHLSTSARATGLFPGYRPPISTSVKLTDVLIRGRNRKIQGTVASPKKVPPVAAALFLGGSGSHDRHGFTGELDLGYHDLLDELPRHGIVTLRYERLSARERRGGGGKALGLGHLLNDARSCYHYLQRLPETRATPKILIGHSLGGVLALILASRIPDLAGVITLAAPKETMRTLLTHQQREIAEQIGL